MDVSYLGCFVPKTIRIQVGRFIPSGLDVSYPKSGRFVPKDWTVRTQGLYVSYPVLFFLIFCFWFDVFASKLVSLLSVGRFVPIFCSFPILDLVFFTCIYSPMCDFSRISHCKSYEMNRFLFIWTPFWFLSVFESTAYLKFAKRLPVHQP